MTLTLTLFLTLSLIKGVLHLLGLRCARRHRQGLQARTRGGADRQALRSRGGDAAHPHLRSTGRAV